jgi:hypothetical protein
MRSQEAHNFCREHETLGKTPAEQGGIKLDLKENKVESLFQLCSTNFIHKNR